MVQYDCPAGFITQILKKQARSPSSQRSSKPTEIFRALAVLPWAENHVPVVFKLFSPKYQSGAMFNELFCFRLARSRRLPLPRDVCRCPVNRNSIIGPSRCLEGRSPDTQWISGIASVDASPNGVVQIRTSSMLERVANELREWPYLADVAVFDELVINIDRTQHNLYRIGPGNYILIDHAEALGGQGWTLPLVEQMASKPSPRNDLAAFIAEETDARTQNAMIATAVEYSKQTRITEQALGVSYTTFDKLCSFELGTTEQVTEMLNQRMTLLPELVFRHVRRTQLGLQ